MPLGLTIFPKSDSEEFFGARDEVTQRIKSVLPNARFTKKLSMDDPKRRYTKKQIAEIQKMAPNGLKKEYSNFSSLRTDGYCVGVVLSGPDKENVSKICLSMSGGEDAVDIAILIMETVGGKIFMSEGQYDRNSGRLRKELIRCLKNVNTFDKQDGFGPWLPGGDRRI